jgi:hypothetical protein
MVEQVSICSDCEFLSREHHEPQEVRENHIMIVKRKGVQERQEFLLAPPYRT